jgi:uncharacterized protein YycO
MSVRLRFFGSTGLPSDTIEWFSAGYFSHVAALWDDKSLLDSRSDVVGGVPPGVRIRPQLAESARIMVTMELGCNQSQLLRWRTFLTSQIGKPYDKPGIFGFAFNRDWREPDSWFCSELQAAALETAGISPHLYAPANKITPVALATIFSALGARILE